MISDTPSRLGKYEVRALLGQGAMGRVYQCHDPDIDRLVAVKVILPGQLDERHAEEMRARFRREARAAARCQHANIVTVYDVGEQDGCSFIVMEYVQGEELRFFLDRGETLGDGERIYILQEVLKALDHAHTHGVVHRDVKPANIILTDDGGVKVADFGVARIEDSDLTLSGSMLGTPTYMSPEGLRGEPVGPAGDLYSVGMVMLEMFSGYRPTPEDLYQGKMKAFVDRVLSSSGEGFPEPLRAVARKALAFEPKHRFTSARAFLEALTPHAGRQEQAPGEVLSQTVISRAPLPVGEPASPGLGAQQVEWPAEWLQQVRDLLAEQVGPLADVLVQRSTTQVENVEALGESLAKNIPDEAERTDFLKRIRASASGLPLHMRSGCGTAAERSHRAADTTAKDMTAGSAGLALGEEAVEALSGLYAQYMGPLAGELVRHLRSQAPDVGDLLERLASQIPDPGDRRHFLGRARKLV